MDAATMKALDDLRGRCLDALAESPWDEGTEGYNLFAGYLDNAAERDSIEHYRNHSVRALVAAATEYTEAMGCGVPTYRPATLAELETQLVDAYRMAGLLAATVHGSQVATTDRNRLAVIGRLHQWTGVILEANDTAAADADNLEDHNATASERANANRESWGA